MNKIKTIVLAALMLMLLSPTTLSAQTVVKSESPSTTANKPLTTQQLKVALVNTQNELYFAQQNLIRCDDAVKALGDAVKSGDQEREGAAAERAAAIKERETAAALVAKLNGEVLQLRVALATSEEMYKSASERATISEKEAIRQKTRASIWKKVAKYGTLIGIAIGGAAGVMIAK